MLDCVFYFTYMSYGADLYIGCLAHHMDEFSIHRIINIAVNCRAGEGNGTYWTYQAIDNCIDYG